MKTSSFGYLKILQVDKALSRVICSSSLQNCVCKMSLTTNGQCLPSMEDQHFLNPCSEQSQMDDISRSSNISGRRLLIRALRESLIMMEQREETKQVEYKIEIDKLVNLNEVATSLIESVEEGIQKLCIICHDREKSVILMPCRHLCLCLECSNHSAVNSCPKCRTVISTKISVYSWNSRNKNFTHPLSLNFAPAYITVDEKVCSTLYHIHWMKMTNGCHLAPDFRKCFVSQFKKDLVLQTRFYYIMITNLKKA